MDNYFYVKAFGNHYVVIDAYGNIINHEYTAEEAYKERDRLLKASNKK